MKKILLSLSLTTLLFAATPEQVDRYLGISNADEQLAELETQFAQMQNNINRLNPDQENPQYNMQMISIRFKEYLQKHLSEEEMDEIIKAYRNVLLLQYVAATSESQTTDPREIEAYLKELESDPDMQERMALVQKISSEMYDQESMAIMFDNLMKPLLENAPGGQKLDKETMEKSRKAYIEKMQEETWKETLYATKDFTHEELEKLEEIAKKPVIKQETRAVFGATAYALEEFFLSLANRYDIKKHQSKQP
jgi:hypothetical protein